MRASGSIDFTRNYAENLTSIAKNCLTDMVRPSTARDLRCLHGGRLVRQSASLKRPDLRSEMHLKDPDLSGLLAS